MLTAALTLLLATAQADEPAADASYEDAQVATPESVKAEALAKLSRCGVTAKQLKVEKDESTGQVYAVLTTPAAKIAPPTYVCLAKAEMVDGAAFSFADDEATQPFWRAHEDAGREIARDNLRGSGLLDRLPLYDPAKQSLADYAHALEKLCGVARGKGFKVARPDWLTLPDSMMEGLEPPSACLLDAAGASNLHEHGITFGVDAPAAE